MPHFHSDTYQELDHVISQGPQPFHKDQWALLYDKLLREGLWQSVIYLSPFPFILRVEV